MKDTCVLVLDDEQSVLTSLNKLFSGESFGVYCTTRYEDAIEVLENEKKIKIVISDQTMPVVTGLAFLKQVRNQFPALTRVLFASAVELGEAERAMKAGEVSGIIRKPWNDTELKATVLDLLQKSGFVPSAAAEPAPMPAIETLAPTTPAEVAVPKPLPASPATPASASTPAPASASPIATKQIDFLTRQVEELKQINEKLEKVCMAQSDFTSTASHELRSPLASIKTALDIITQERFGKLNEKQLNFLGIAKQNVDRLSRMVDGILDLTKMEKGEDGLKIEDIDLNQLVRDVCDVQRPVAEKKSLTLEPSLDERLKTIQMDRDKVTQVLTNLVNNALKFTQKGGITVITALETELGRVKVTVKDTGPGIRKEDMCKLFQKFKQLDKGSNKLEKGTGLGLAICKEIASRHGGDIWVESETGVGSLFCFTLPLAGSEAQG